MAANAVDQVVRMQQPELLFWSTGCTTAHQAAVRKLESQLSGKPYAQALEITCGECIAS